MTKRIARHKTALKRSELSLPMRTLLQLGFLEEGSSVFDFGCGRGSDIALLAAMGIEANGWDPKFRPKSTKGPSEFVNLGYVLNVIEDTLERAATLTEAFKLANKAMLVSVMLGYTAKREQYAEHRDGVITKRSTFQKYFTQEEFKQYLEQTLSRNAIPVAPGMCLVFTNDIDEQLFLLSRQQVRRQWRLLHQDPSHKKVAELVAQSRDTLDEYWSCALELGRPPTPEEVPTAQPLTKFAGSWKKVHVWASQFFDPESFRAASLARREDLLVYFALAHFSRRKPYSDLPGRLQKDIKFFFSNISTARAEGKEILFSISNPEQIEAAGNYVYEQLGIGRINEGHDLVFHESLLSECPALLRVYVGCAAQLFGDVEAVDLVKVHFQSGKVSFMTYDDFDGREHPLLLERVKVNLPRLKVEFFDYGYGYEPQPLEGERAEYFRHGTRHVN